MCHRWYSKGEPTLGIALIKLLFEGGHVMVFHEGVRSSVARPYSSLRESKRELKSPLLNFANTSLKVDEID